MAMFRLTLFVDGKRAWYEGRQKAIFDAMQADEYEPSGGDKVEAGAVGTYRGLPLLIQSKKTKAD